MKNELPNFDILKKIAETNPQELEDLRYKLSNEIINSAPKRLHKRLRGLQFQIDTKRKLSKTALSSCIQISAMMHNSLEELREALAILPKANSSTYSKAESCSANILSFPNN